MNDLEASIHAERVSGNGPCPWLLIGRDDSVRVYTTASVEEGLQVSLGGETTIEEIECPAPDSSPSE